MAFSFKFSADGSEFTRGLTKMKGEVKSFAKSGAKMMAGMFVGAMTIRGIRSMMDELDRIGKLSQRFGATSEEIQRLGLAAELNGSNFERLAKAMTDATRMAQEATGTNKRAKDAFDAMNISVEDFLKMSLEEKVQAVSDGFLDAEKSGKGFESAAVVLGMSFKELVPLLKQGGAAIKEQGKQAGIASEKTVILAQKVNDDLTVAFSKAKGIFFTVMEFLIERMKDAMMFTAIFANHLQILGEKAAGVGKMLKSAFTLDFTQVKKDLDEMNEKIEKMKKLDLQIAMQRFKFDKPQKPQNSIANPSNSIEQGEEKEKSKDLVDDQDIKKDAQQERIVSRILQLRKEISESQKESSFDALDNAEKLEFIEKRRLQLVGIINSRMAAGGASNVIKSLEAVQELLKLKREYKSITNTDQDKKSSEISDLEQQLVDGQSNLQSLQSKSVSSSIISSGLRSIGGGGAAKVTRDPSVQIALKSQQILAQIAANTATQDKMDALQKTQDEF